MEAALLCERAGADGITAHLREDRRHIQDADVMRLAASVSTVLNLEMALTDEMLDLAARLRPHQVTLVPERREEVTTEGGLDVARHSRDLTGALARLKRLGIRTSLFIDPDPALVQRSRDVGADAVELHTGQYARAPHESGPIAAIADAARQAASLGLFVHAGHGLTRFNVGPVARVPEIEELNIGHSVVSHAVFVGLEQAVRTLRSAMDDARRDAAATR